MRNWLSKQIGDLKCGFIGFYRFFAVLLFLCLLFAFVIAFFFIDRMF